MSMNRYVVLSLMAFVIVILSHFCYEKQQNFNLVFDRASAQELEETAFPEDEAGLAAYIWLGSLDFEKIKTAADNTMTEIKDTDGGSYIYGLIPVSGKVYEASWTDNVHLYADVNGWIVAFLPRNDPSSKLVYWTGGDEGSYSILSNYNTLEIVLQNFLGQLGVDFSNVRSNIKYYHFGYPDATKLLTFIVYGSKTVDFYVPQQVTLYEVSYNLLDNDDTEISTIKLQNRQVASVDGGRTVGKIEEDPIESTEEFKKPGGLVVGEKFSVTVKYYPILDRDGDGKVTVSDIVIDTTSAEVVGVDAKNGVVTLEVKTYSTVDMPFKLTYRGSKIIPVYSGQLYELESQEEEYGDCSVAVVMIYK